MACGGSKASPATPSGGNGGVETKAVASSGGADSDKDGIPDSVDQCKFAPENKNGVEDDDGCPEFDQDQDGIIGKADQCPAEAEDKDGDKDDDGCPDLDGDQDGVADAIDQCPKEKENNNGYLDADGCADELPPPVKKFSGTIDGIEFKSGSATFTRGTYKVLTHAAAVMAEYKTIRFEISGHTDNAGDPTKNMDLSLERAKAVRAYLIKKGVAPTRLEARGFGDTRPKADNSTKAGRAKNRRVEFRLLEEA